MVVTRGLKLRVSPSWKSYPYEPCRPTSHVNYFQTQEGQSHCQMITALLAFCRALLCAGSQRQQGRRGTAIPDVCMGSSELNLVDLVSRQHPSAPFAVEGIDPRALAALQSRTRWHMFDTLV